MLFPSIDSLMTKIDSKYSLVSVAAKRARSMQVHMDPKIDKYVSYKFVGKALEEINAEKLHFKTAASHEELNINE